MGAAAATDCCTERTRASRTAGSAVSCSKSTFCSVMEKL